MTERNIQSSLPDNEQQGNAVNESRRSFVKKAAYVPPAVLTLKAAPAFAKNGSAKPTPPRGRGPQGNGPPGQNR